MTNFELLPTLIGALLGFIFFWSCVFAFESIKNRKNKKRGY